MVRQRGAGPVGNSDDFGPLGFGIGQRLACAPGIAGETDADDGVALADPQDVLENLADAVGLDQAHVLENQVEVKTHKRGQGSRGPSAQNVNPVGGKQRFHHGVEVFLGDFLQRGLDFLHVSRQNRTQHVVLIQPVVGDFDALDGGELA